MSTRAVAGPDPAPPVYALHDLLTYLAQLGTVGFGGPVALVGRMRRDLVEQRGWISEADYTTGLALAQMSPGPLAAQLAIYLGYVHYRVRGATLAGLAFIVPSFLMVVALGWAYTAFGHLGWLHAAFYGVGASVIGIVAHSAYSLTRRTLGKDPLLWTIGGVLALVTILTETEAVLLFLIAGLLVWLVQAPPQRFRVRVKAPVASLGFPLAAAVFAPVGTLWALFLFFVQAGAFVFGSGLAIVPFLYGGVVKTHHWLTNGQFVDAVAVAMLTPGPVVITSGFIGFLVAGVLGAGVAALGTFLPGYLITIVATPAFRRYGTLPGVAAFVRGVTAAAVGAIAGAVVVLGRRAIVDVPTLLLAGGAALLLWQTKRVPEPVIVLVAGVIGVILYPLLHH